MDSINLLKAKIESLGKAIHKAANVPMTEKKNLDELTAIVKTMNKTPYIEGFKGNILIDKFAVSFNNITVNPPSNLSSSNSGGES